MHGPAVAVILLVDLLVAGRRVVLPAPPPAPPPRRPYLRAAAAAAAALAAHRHRRRRGGRRRGDRPPPAAARGQPAAGRRCGADGWSRGGDGMPLGIDAATGTRRPDGRLEGRRVAVGAERAAVGGRLGAAAAASSPQHRAPASRPASKARWGAKHAGGPSTTRRRGPPRCVRVLRDPRAAVHLELPAVAVAPLEAAPASPSSRLAHHKGRRQRPV